MTVTVPAARIAQIEARFAELTQAMAAPDLGAERFVEMSKEYAELDPVAKAAAEVRRLRDELTTTVELEQDASAEADMREMAAAEAEELRAALEQAELALALKLLPRDAADERPAMLEIRAGTGGDEAALFAGDLFRMYQRYAEERG